MNHSSILVTSTIILSFAAFKIFWNHLPKHNRWEYFGALLLLLALSFGSGVIYTSYSILPVSEEPTKPLRSTVKTVCAESEINLHQGDFVAIRLAETQSLFRYTGINSKVRISTNGGNNIKVLTIDLNDGSRLHKLPRTSPQRDNLQLLALHN